jgi:1-acyl-sn-glycerol-3-phosphate acyltransferase
MILRSRNLAYHLVHAGSRVMTETFATLECEGWDRLPAGPCLLAANHQSLLDPPLIGAALPAEVAFVARKTLFENPVFGWVIRACHALPLDRDEADLAAIRRALAVLAEGRKLVIFPEGTRSADGALLPAKAGAGLLALKSGVPVVPIRIRGARDVLPRGGWLPTGGARIRIRFGEPLAASELDAGAGHPGRYLEASRRILAAIAALPDCDPVAL